MLHLCTKHYIKKSGSMMLQLSRYVRSISETILQTQHYVPNDLSTRVFTKKQGSAHWVRLEVPFVLSPTASKKTHSGHCSSNHQRIFQLRWFLPNGGMLCWRDRIHWVILAMLLFFCKHTSRTFIKQLNCETSAHITSSRNHEFIKGLKEIQRILKKSHRITCSSTFAGCFIYAII